MNRLDELFAHRDRDVLSIYLTAGYPHLDDTGKVLQHLEAAGVDFVEIGMPFSDPLADGSTIQQTSECALANGMTISRYFEQVSEARSRTSLPFVFMGYLNQVYRLGPEPFVKQCKAAGIDAAIIPDLPMDVYEKEFKPLFEFHQLGMAFLVTPQTSPARMQQAAALSSAFLYVVADNSITGSQSGITDEQIAYFQRIKHAQLKCPTMIGFGISDRTSFATACAHARGAIVGSAFLRAIEHDASSTTVSAFIQTLRN